MLVLILSLIAMLIPYFADCMSLLGAVASTFLMFIFPIVFDWKLFGMLDPPSSLLASASSAAAAVVAGNGLTMATRRRRSRLDFWAGVGVLVLGVYVGVLGGGQALLSLYNDVMNGDTSGRGGHK